MILFKTKKSLWRAPVYLLGIALISFAPILVAMLAGFIGQCMGIQVNEGGTDPGVRFGIPFGDILSMVAIFGWLCILTLPAGVIAGLACVIITIIDAASLFKTKRDRSY